jgi:hypothetical protein
MAKQAVRNQDLASDVQRAENFLTNGTFSQWQRGNGPFTTINAYTADRWQVYGENASPSTLSVTRNAMSTAAGDPPGQYCAQCVFTVSGTNRSGLSQRIENAYVLRGKQVSLSYWIKTTVAQYFTYQVNSDVGGNAVSASIFVAANTWTRLTATLTVDPAATYLMVYLLTSTVGTPTSCTFFIANVSLVVGAVAADIVPRTPAGELVECLRYYEVLALNGGQEFIISGIATAAQTIYQTMLLKAVKVVNPTSTIGGTWTYNNATGLTLDLSVVNALRFHLSSVAAGSFYVYNAGTNPTLTAEANP